MREPAQSDEHRPSYSLRKLYSLFYVYINYVVCVKNRIVPFTIYMQWLNEKKVGEKKKNEKVSDYDSD